MAINIIPCDDTLPLDPGFTIDIYDNSIDPVTYFIPTVTTTEVITDVKWAAVQTSLNDEALRRSYSFSPATFSGIITAAEFNHMADAIQGMYSGSTVIDEVVGDLIDEINFNKLINNIISAGSLCVCDTNLCTCNCNNCACDCNYCCTCNCNYF